MTIDQRIGRLEKAIRVTCPGTQLVRGFKVSEGGGTNWTLALGGMHMRMRFFVANTIEECLRSAEKELGIRK